MLTNNLHTHCAKHYSLDEVRGRALEKQSLPTYPLVQSFIHFGVHLKNYFNSHVCPSHYQLKLRSWVNPWITLFPLD